MCENEKSRLPFIKIHILYNLLVELYHHEGLTRGHIDTPEKLELNIKDQGAFLSVGQIKFVLINTIASTKICKGIIEILNKKGILIYDK